MSRLRLGFAATALVAACSSSNRMGPGGSGPVTTVTVTPSPDTVLVSGSKQLSAVGTDSTGAVVAGVTFTWVSGNSNIAAVSTSGQVTGVAPGPASISASTGGVTGQAQVQVVAPAVGTVQVLPGVDSVGTGEIRLFQAVVRDTSGAIIPSVALSWSSSNGSMAGISVVGVATGVSPGSVTITATSGGVMGTASLTVVSPFTRADNTRVPLSDMGAATYLGFPGGLYPGGNALPAAHAAAGIHRANLVRPLDGAGNPSAVGKYVMLSIGISNTTQEFCVSAGDQNCNSWSFVGQATRDAVVKNSVLRFANGAKGGQGGDTWNTPTAPNYDRVRDSVLAPLGLTEKQVQIVWLKVADLGPTVSLPEANADAVALLGFLGGIVRSLHTRYPNLQLVFVDSRTYGGYATIPLNPEPYAYESGFSVKWLVEAQIRQMASGGSLIDPIAGNLNYSSVAPWVGWGPYLWANGAIPRGDGFTWLGPPGGPPPSDVESDGTHPSDVGEQKVGALLVSFFKSSPEARCWFATGGTCP